MGIIPPTPARYFDCMCNLLQSRRDAGRSKRPTAGRLRQPTEAASGRTTEGGGQRRDDRGGQRRDDLSIKGQTLLSMQHLSAPQYRSTSSYD